MKSREQTSIRLYETGNERPNRTESVRSNFNNFLGTTRLLNYTFYAVFSALERVENEGRELI